MTTQIRVLSPPCPEGPSRVVRAAHQHIEPRTCSACNPPPLKIEARPESSAQRLIQG